MPGVIASLYVTSIPRLVAYVFIWLILVMCARILVRVYRNDPLLGWAVGPLGVSTLYVSEPSPVFILFYALFPAIVSAFVLYLGLFTAIPSPLSLPQNPLFEILIITVGVLITSTVDFLDALRDLRYPLWGEARILRNIQLLRASWASIHFTPFGLSYLREHFGSNPSDLLQSFSNNVSQL
ncbi:MAG TPA: hypothetical protein VE843_12090 [Ktedonobacteraceae bacterium]|nr:hypothetical protein [Ktedonobacteraceae bacterium]